MKKPLGILFDLGDTVLEYYYNNPIEGTKKILENSINPYNTTAEKNSGANSKVNPRNLWKKISDRYRAYRSWLYI